MPLPAEGPCEPWCSWAQVMACGDGLTETNPAAEVQTSVIAQASEIIYNLSERRYPGECETTRSVCLRCRGCATSPCCCRPRERLDLGLDYVSGVSEVVIDGEVLDPESYRVDSFRWLVRLDGETWPRCADLTEPDAFQVTWTYGRAIPIGGQLAAAALARELALPCVGGKCQIPQHVTSVTRDNVTYTILDSLRIFTEGRTGVGIADLWLGSLKVADHAPGGIFDPGAKCVELPELDTGTSDVT